MSPFHKAVELSEISDINVVPLADVSLVLLIILLVLSPMMTQSMLHVRTAGASAGPPAPPEEVSPQPEVVLAVALGPAGFAVGERLFAAPSEFASFLRGELGRRSDRKVFLSPRPEVLHGAVVDALELIKSCGAESIALVQTVEEASGVLPSPAPALPRP